MLRNVGGWIIIITSLIVRSNVKRLHRLRRHLRGQQQIGEGGQRFALDTFVHGPVPVAMDVGLWRERVLSESQPMAHQPV